MAALLAPSNNKCKSHSRGYGYLRQKRRIGRVLKMLLRKRLIVIVIAVPQLPPSSGSEHSIQFAVASASSVGDFGVSSSSPPHIHSNLEDGLVIAKRLFEARKLPAQHSQPSSHTKQQQSTAKLRPVSS